MTEGISEIHDFMHLAIQRVESSSSDGSLGSEINLRAAYNSLSGPDRLVVRELLQHNMVSSLRDAKFRESRAWLQILDAVTQDN